MYNVVGALIWTVLFLGAGYFFGNLPGRFEEHNGVSEFMTQLGLHLQTAPAGRQLWLLSSVACLLLRSFVQGFGTCGQVCWFGVRLWCAELSMLLCCLCLQWFSTTSHLWCWALLLCQCCLYCWR